MMVRFDACILVSGRPGRGGLVPVSPQSRELILMADTKALN